MLDKGYLNIVFVFICIGICICILCFCIHNSLSWNISAPLVQIMDIEQFLSHVIVLWFVFVFVSFLFKKYIPYNADRQLPNLPFRRLCIRTNAALLFDDKLPQIFRCVDFSCCIWANAALLFFDGQEAQCCMRGNLTLRIILILGNRSKST